MASLHPVRLIKIYGSSNDVQLKVVDSKDTVPPYIAISHTWSSNDDSKPSALEAFSVVTKTIGDGDYTSRINIALSQKKQSSVVKGLVFIAREVLDLGSYRMENCTSADNTLWNDTIRYFWVDAICLDQQDHQDKLRDLLHMNTIYKNCQSVICVLQPLPDIFTPPPVTCEQPSQKFRWFYRIWTYQERYLNENVFFLDKNVDRRLWKQILDNKCRQEERHCKRMSPEEKNAHLMEYLEKISSGYIERDTGNLDLMEGSTYEQIVLPYIEGDGHPVSSLAERQYILTEDMSLAHLMFYTRHRKSKYDEDRVIGLLGMLDITIAAQDLYGNGVVGTLNSVMEGMPKDYCRKHMLEFLICGWYNLSKGSGSSGSESVIDLLLPDDDIGYTGLLHCLEYDNRDMIVSRFEKGFVHVNAEVISATYTGNGYDNNLDNDEPYIIHFDAGQTNHSGLGKVDEPLQKFTCIDIFLVRAVYCRDYFGDDECEEVFLLCILADGMYVKRGIVIIAPGLLHGSRLDIQIR